MSKKDYYETLGVDRSASPDMIKRAYRSKVKDCHPDLHPGDPQAEAMFKEITEAYEVLSSADKRSAYDHYGHAAFEQGGAGGFGGFPFGDNLSSVFEEVFNGFMGQRSAYGSDAERLRGEDIRYDLTISLQEAFTGVKKTISVSTFKACEACGGVGGTDVIACPVCGGRGRIRRQNGFFMMETPCSACGGTGKSVKHPCSECHSTGRVKVTKKIEVSIPAGVDTGVRMRLTGEGNAGAHGGACGDLYVFITVEDNPLFIREDANLLCEVPVPMTVAALGGTIQVPTLDGKPQDIKLPEGTQTGYEVKLNGLGMPLMKSNKRGALFVRIVVETPTHLSAKQKELLRAFSDDSTAVNPKTQSFFDKVKAFFE